ncbi:MAG: hypothetical protein FJ248_06280 [Nitrospira sp.]|nr:hypothetical protein [Nitrospira sp.]
MSVEKHQLAGLDGRARGFNRVVEIERGAAGCCAMLRYEQTVIGVEGHPTEAAALHGLVVRLQSQGYTQLRSQLSFQGSAYLGSREPWIEYPDPSQPSFLGRLFGKLFGRRGTGPIAA